MYEGHASSVLCLVLTCDGENVISGSEDKTVKAWHLKTKNCATLKGHGGRQLFNDNCVFKIKLSNFLFVRAIVRNMTCP